VNIGDIKSPELLYFTSREVLGLRITAKVYEEMNPIYRTQFSFFIEWYNGDKHIYSEKGLPSLQACLRILN
jgi:hypothetical protein